MGDPTPRGLLYPARPALASDEHPELFSALRRVAQRTGQPMPREVYAVLEMNAWVTNRGGMMGFGSRPVMGLGLPLLQVTSAAQFEAILAHEFGHYYGGDTRLGPWIYKTPRAIGRTLSNPGGDNWLRFPFRWYGNFFLRITQAISRAQEFAADRLAATVVGAEPLVEGLKTVRAHAGTFDAFWEDEAVRVLEAGYRPPLVEGYERLLRTSRIQKAMTETLSHGLEHGEGDPYDSHPPLRERIAAVEGLAAAPDRAAEIAEDGTRAIDLLGDTGEVERGLIATMTIDGDPSQFRPISWDEVTERVYLPQWRNQPQRFGGVLGSATLAELPGVIRSRGTALARVELEEEAEVDEKILPQLIGPVLGACVAAALVDAGWTASTKVGEPTTVRKGQIELRPFAIIKKLYAEDDSSWWTDFLEEHDLGHLALAGPDPATATVH